MVIRRREGYLASKHVNRSTWQSRVIGYYAVYARSLSEISAIVKNFSLATNKPRAPKSKGRKKMTIRVVEPDCLPPPWKTVVPFFRSVRLITTAAQAEFPVTVNQILRLQSFAATTTLAYPIAYAIRLKRVRMWGSPAVANAPSSVYIEWNAGSTGFLLDGVSVSNTSVSTTRPAYIVSRPPTESLGSWYQAGVSGGTNELFQFTCVTGTMIQVDYDWVPNFTEPALASFAITSYTVGTVFAQNWSATITCVAPLNSQF